MRVWLERYCRLLELLVAAMLTVMVVLVFGNVVLRYAFNSGITVSEELSRWLFVWLTMLGAVIAIARHGHLGTDVLVSRLGLAGKKVCAALAHLLMLYVTWLLLRGLWEQTQINMNVAAPATGWPVGIVYLAGIVFALSAIVLLAINGVAALRSRGDDAALVMVRDSEDLARVEPPDGGRAGEAPRDRGGA
jgi:TRAP-type C4-dicarboxylate transport system permease small subunit